MFKSFSEVNKQIKKDMKKVPLATRRTIKKVSVSVKAEIAKIIITKYAIKASGVKANTKTKNTDRTTNSNIAISGSRVPLYYFKASPNKVLNGNERPNSYQAKISNARGFKEIHGMFLAKIGKRNMAMIRTGYYNIKNHKERIRKMYGPSIPTIIEKEEIINEIIEFAENRIGKTLDSELAFELRRKK